MFSNYTKNIIPLNQFNENTVDNMVWRILLDMAETEDGVTTASGIIKNNSKIEKHTTSNLQDLNNDTGEKLLVTFNYNQADPRNTDWARTSNCYNTTYHKVYTVYLTMIASDTNKEQLKNITQIISNNLTNNYATDGENISIPVPYNATQDIIYKTNLELNIASDALITPEFENPANQGYITSIIDILFIVEPTTTLQAKP